MNGNDKQTFNHNFKGYIIFLAYFPLGSNSSWKMLTGKASVIEATDEAYNNFPNEKVNLNKCS
jgi:hypothetical protein